MPRLRPAPGYAHRVSFFVSRLQGPVHRHDMNTIPAIGSQVDFGPDSEQDDTFRVLDVCHKLYEDNRGRSHEPHHVHVHLERLRYFYVVATIQTEEGYGTPCYAPLFALNKEEAIQVGRKSFPGFLKVLDAADSSDEYPEADWNALT